MTKIGAGDALAGRGRRADFTPSFCRLCINACSILVKTVDGRAVRVVGDADSPLYGGYTCSKGRSQPRLLRRPDRLLHPLRRGASGALEPVASSEALDDIARRLDTLLAQHGPRAVAGYAGTNATATVLGAPFLEAFLHAIGSPMLFTPGTIDKPGKFIARALHGRWMAPWQGFDDPEVILLVGINPIVTYTGFPAGNPRRWLTQTLDGGARLIVVDPRRSDVARAATMHLQARPGTDAAILAAFLRVIIDEGLHDADFVAENVAGLDALSEHLRPFDADAVARLAGVPASDLAEAARMFAGARRGFAVAGTGANMSGRGTLVEYLLLDLETVCGHWQRAGERVRNPGVLLPAGTPKGQASPPTAGYGIGERMRVRGLAGSAAGLPTAALADEILLEGDGQVRALISCGGNPAIAWPNQVKTVAALRSLDLLVQVDPWLSETAALATFVIPPPMPLETPATTIWGDFASSLGAGYGLRDPFAQWTPPVAKVPSGSDLLEEWALFHGLARRLGLQLRVHRHLGIYVESIDGEDDRVDVDMDRSPATEDLLELLSSGSRIPLEEVRSHPHGAFFLEPELRVAPKDPGWSGRLDCANPDMMRELDELATTAIAGSSTRTGDDVVYPMRLVCRREKHTYNTSSHDASTNHGRPYNPAFLHPDDMGRHDLLAGDIVEIRSAAGAINAVAQADPTLRCGIVSMAFGYGAADPDGADVRLVGSSPSRLIDDEHDFDRFSGQPRMSDIAVSVRPAPGGRP